MSLSNELNSLIKVKKIKKGLDDPATQTPIDTQKGVSSGSGADENSSGLTPPLTIEILTYDDTKDIEFKDTSDAVHTIKTALTAKITDADGIEYEIDTITYAAP
ncbi:MAG: hypothetical protein GY694_12985 [Gammaproteobacteria bacterium]|nr:hypothetical protein [Gammaproteobacteria bacterium]